MRRPSPLRGSATFGAILFAIAFAPRLAVALAFAGEPVWDGHYYDFGARRIALGLGYSDDVMVGGHPVWHPWCHYPVGYSALLGLFYRVLGPSPFTAHLANASIGALLAVVTWRLADRGLSASRARIAGLLVALYPGLVLYGALLMSEPLAALLTLTAFWLAVRDSLPLRGAIVGALTLGVAALVRPQALLCAPFLAFVLFRARHGFAATWPRAIAAAGALSVVALLPVLPWTARNCRVMDGCALVSTNAGWNLAIGAFPRATGRFETLRSSDGCREVTGQVQQDRCWLEYGLRQIGENPRRWMSLVPAKLGYTFDHESFAVEYLREARPSAWPEERRVRVRGLTTVAHRLLVCAAALGCVALGIRGARVQVIVFAGLGLLAYLAVAGDAPTFWPLAVATTILPWIPLPGRPRFPVALVLPVSLLATTVSTHAVFFGEDRYHMVVTPVFCMLAAAALRKPKRVGEPVRPA